MEQGERSALADGWPSAPSGRPFAQTLRHLSGPITLVILVVIVAVPWVSDSTDHGIHRVAVLIPGSVRYFDVEVAAMRNQARKRGVELEVMSAKWSVATQLQQLRLVSDASADFDGIAISTVDSDAMAAGLADIELGDTPLITFTNAMGPRADGKYPGVTTHVGRDEETSGRLLADQVAELGLDAPRVLEVGGAPGTAPQRLRSRGFRLAMSSHPDWVLSDSVFIEGWELDRVEPEVLRSLSHKDVDVIVVQWADAAVVVSRSLRRAGLGHIAVVALEWTDQIKQEIRAGRVRSSTYQSVDMEGRVTIDTMQSAIEGRATEPFIEIPQQIVDRDQEHLFDADW